MTIALTTTPLAQLAVDWLVLGIDEKSAFSTEIAAIDAALGGTLTRLRARGDLTGKLGETTELPDVPTLACQRVCLVGLGDGAALTVPRLDKAMMTVARKLSTKAPVSVAINLPRAGHSLSLEQVAKTVACAATVGCVGQGLYKQEPDRHPFKQVSLAVDTVTSSVAQAVVEGQILGESINLTRELVNLAPADIYPETFCQRAAAVAASIGVRCEVLDEHRLATERMQSLLAVAKGSPKAPRVVMLEYHGAAPDSPIVAIVGKGVTFDSGGLSLKPSDSMKTMKCDMSGAATMLGAMAAIVRLKLPINVLGIAGLVENMTGGAAYKLGDVLKARNGVTIEVMNTDAEGRLVLADVLSYVVDRKVGYIVDLATLTGACVVALGEEVTGVFTNNQPWCDRVLASAKTVGEDAWQFPMFDSFAEQLKCDVADIKNIGTRWGGAITAAKFLEKFVGGVPWVHLDIAGPAFVESSKPHKDGGGTGAMLRTLVELVRGGV